MKNIQVKNKMPHTPPIKRNELRKNKAFDDERFYRELSESCGYISHDMAQRYYLSLVKVITKRLKNEDLIRLPHLGDFALVQQQEKKVLGGKDIAGRYLRRVLPAQKILKFYPLDSWRKYFNMFK